MLPRVSQRVVAESVRWWQDALPGCRGLWTSTGIVVERNTTGHAAPGLSRSSAQAGRGRLLPPTLNGSSQLHLPDDSTSPSCSLLGPSRAAFFLRAAMGDRCLPKRSKTACPRTQCFSQPFHSASTSYHLWKISKTDRASELEMKGLACTVTGGSGPLVMTSLPRRSLNIFSVFSKEERDKAKERLRDELNRGYFDDFKELKETNGKVGGPAPASLLPAAGAAQFPPLETFTAHGPGPLLPPEGSRALVFVSFRAGAQGMVDSWILKLLAPGATPHPLPPMTQVSFVESGVLSLPILRPLVLRMLRPPNMPSQSAPPAASPTKTPGLSLSSHAVDSQDAGETPEPTRASAQAPAVAGREQGGDSGQPGPAGEAGAGRGQGRAVAVVYAFGDTWSFRKSLRIRNKLTGYVFLVDRKGRVRWRGTGFPTDDEIQSLCSALEKLQHE